MSRQPKALIRCATRTPIRPRPTTPIVLSVTSTPVKRLRFHSPDFKLDVACGTRRATDNSSAIACSAAETMLDVGALTTRTPRAVAAGTSTLSRPTPARATTLSWSAAASASASTCVALRTMIASTPLRAGRSAPRSAPSTVRTSKSLERTSSALGANSSPTRTTGLDTRPGLRAAPNPTIRDGDRENQPRPAQSGQQEADERDRRVARNARVRLHPGQQRGADDECGQHQPDRHPVGHAVQSPQEIGLVECVDAQLEPTAGERVHRPVDPARQLLGEVARFHRRAENTGQRRRRARLRKRQRLFLE